MAELSIDVSKPDLTRLTAALKKLQTNTGRSCFQAVMFASVRCAESLRAASKPSKPKRDVIKNPLFGMSKKRLAMLDTSDAMSRYRYMIRYDFREQKPFWYTNDKNDPRTVITKRGLARNMWNKVAAKAASTRGNTMYHDEQAAFNVFTNADVTAATLANELTYLTDAYGPGHVNAAVDTATRKLEYDAMTSMEKWTREFNRL